MTAATVADHIRPHRGDPALFFDPTNLQSLCDEYPWRCHSSVKQSEERLGYSKAIGADGWPIDPNYGVKPKRWGWSIPDGIKPSAIPCTIVCGPPASGKSTFVRARARPGDTVIDLDEINIKVGGKRWTDDRGTLAKSFAYRERMLHGLASKAAGHAFIIVMAPTNAERQAWAKATGGEVVLLNVPADICKARIMSDPARSHAAHRLCHAVDQWHRSHG